MDLAYWKFRHWPFARSFAVDRFFASETHDEAMSRMLFLIEQSRRCGVIMGPHGIGKSFLIRLAGQRAERLGRLVIRCEATGSDCQEWIKQVAIAMHTACDRETTSSQVWNGIRTRFAALALIRQPVVLLIDHVESSETGCVEAARRLLQLAEMVGLKITMILATADCLVTSHLQEISELRIEVSPLTIQESSSFIRSAIERAGCAKDLFTDDAIIAIHEATSGIPAKIVSLGNVCLLAAQAEDATVVTHRTVAAAVAELFPQLNDSMPPQPSGKRDAWSFVG